MKAFTLITWDCEANVYTEEGDYTANTPFEAAAAFFELTGQTQVDVHPKDDTQGEPFSIDTTEVNIGVELHLDEVRDLVQAVHSFYREDPEKCNRLVKKLHANV